VVPEAHGDRAPVVDAMHAHVAALHLDDERVIARHEHARVALAATDLARGVRARAWPVLEPAQRAVTTRGGREA